MPNSMSLKTVAVVVTWWLASFYAASAVDVAPPSVFSGTLRDDAGKPVGDARITATNVGLHCGMVQERSAEATTDAQGHFTLQTGFYPVYISVWSDGGTMSYPQNPYDSGGKIPTALLRQSEHNLVLMRQAEVRGQVVDGTTGEPVPEFRIHFQTSMIHAPRKYQSKDGRFVETWATPGTQTITVMATGYAPAVFYAVTIPPRSKIDIGVIQMTKGPTLTGRVLSATNGQPIIGAVIRFRDARAHTVVSYPPDELIGTTDLEGRFSIGNMPLLALESYTSIEKPEHRTLTIGTVDMSLAQNGIVDALFFVDVETPAVQIEEPNKSAPNSLPAGQNDIRQTFLRLLALPEPQLRHVREAIQFFKANQDWPSLAVAYEVAAETMWRVTHATPGAFIRPVTEIEQTTAGGRVGPYFMVQTNLDGEWVEGKGEQQNWIDWIQRRQKDLVLERIDVLQKLGALCLDHLDDPPRAVLAYEATGRGVPVCTEPLETLISRMWPVLKVEANEVLALDHAEAAHIRLEPLQRLAEAQIAAGNLRGAADTRLRAMLTALIGDRGDWNAHGSMQEAEAFWQVARRLPLDQPLPPTLWLRVLDPQNPKITVTAPEDEPHGLPYSFPGPRFVIRPGRTARTLTVAADMETPGEGGGVRCFTIIKGKVDDLGWVQWHRDDRQSRGWRQETFDLPEDVGIIRLEITPFNGAGFHIRNLKVEAAFAASGVLPPDSQLRPEPKKYTGATDPNQQPVSDPNSLPARQKASSCAEGSEPKGTDKQISDLFFPSMNKQRAPGEDFNFSWSDIPVLLNIAQSDKRVAWPPSSLASSYAQKEGIEGMIALWRIEELRLKQIGWHGPLNPICCKGNCDNFDAKWETSLEIHQIVLLAYQNWWQKVSLMPARKAAEIDPLDSTDIHWYGEIKPIVMPADPNPLPARQNGKKADNTFIWGQVVGGLRAAVELVPEKEYYSLGEVIGIQFKIQNVSNRPIKLPTTKWRFGNESMCIIQDSNGKKIPMTHVWFSGWSAIERYELLSGEILTLTAASLGLARTTEDAKAFNHPVGYIAALESRKYSLHFELLFPDIMRKDAKGNAIVPLPGDWQGTLITGTRSLCVEPKAIKANSIPDPNSLPVRQRKNSP